MFILWKYKLSLKKINVLLPLKLLKPTLALYFFIILRFRLWQNMHMKILPMYLVYSNYYYLIYMYYYFWQIFAGRPNLYMLFEIIKCPPNDMYLKSLFSQLLFICFVTLEWCMGLCCSQNHTSSPAIQSKEDSASFTRIAEPLSSHISFVREAFFFIHEI